MPSSATFSGSSVARAHRARARSAPVDVDQPRTARQALGRDVPEALAQHPQHCILALVRGLKAVWPPSPWIGIHRPSQRSSPETPKPVPAPIKAMGASGNAAPLPTCRNSPGRSRGNDSASAVKSFSTSRRSKP